MSHLMTTLEMDGDNGRFVASADQKQLGYMDFTILANHVINVYHTYVTPEARGQGVAETLLEALAMYVKKNHYTVYAGCSYVASRLPLRYPEIALA